VILRDLGSLAAARRNAMPLEFEKAKQAADEAGVPMAPAPPATTPTETTPADGKPRQEAPKPPTPPDRNANIATGLEALRAVLPATFITLYSTGVLLLQSYTQSAGAPSRAAQQATLATQFVKDPDALRAALQALTVETKDFLGVRIGFAVLATVALLFQAYKKAQVPGKTKRVILEPTVTTLAFVAWALGAPGTFLAAYMNANQLGVTTIAIVFGAAIALFALSTTVLNKPTAS
jgi:hypothetical protein